MSNGSRLSRRAELSLGCLQIHPPALMMQKTRLAMPARGPFEEHKIKKCKKKNEIKKT